MQMISSFLKDSSKIIETIKFLTKNFVNKDLGLINVILKIKILRISEGKVLSALHFVKNLLKTYYFFNISM